jgi:hypothetical protein
MQFWSDGNANQSTSTGTRPQFEAGFFGADDGDVRRHLTTSGGKGKKPFR